MPGDLKFDDENQLMYVRFDSNSTIDDWKHSLEEVLRLSEETGICRAVIDVRKQATVASTSELFDFGSNLPRSIAFAVLCELHIDDHRFIETVATNRGINVKDFYSEQDAIEWLINYPNKKMDDIKEQL